MAPTNLAGDADLRAENNGRESILTEEVEGRQSENAEAECEYKWRCYRDNSEQKKTV